VRRALWSAARRRRLRAFCRCVSGWWRWLSGLVLVERTIVGCLRCGLRSYPYDQIDARYHVDPRCSKICWSDRGYYGLMWRWMCELLCLLTRCCAASTLPKRDNAFALRGQVALSSSPATNLEPTPTPRRRHMAVYFNPAPANSTLRTRLLSISSTARPPEGFGATGRVST